MSDKLKAYLQNVPTFFANDNKVKLVRWLKKQGDLVRLDEVICELHTSKALVEVLAEQQGHLLPLVEVASFVRVGAPLALLASEPNFDAESLKKHHLSSPEQGSDSRWTKKAALVAKQSGLDIAALPLEGKIREEDVLAYIKTLKVAAPVKKSAWVEMADDVQLKPLKQMLDKMRLYTRQNLKRHVPLGTLLNDRWELADEYGFGSGSSVYDESLIFGDVEVGRSCWIGPFTIVDGAHAKVCIGDFTQIGSGTHVYTHNTIEASLLGEKRAAFSQATTIGRCCFVGPQSIIAPGTTLGDHTFVAAASYVEGQFPAKSYLAGNPAVRVGRVEISEHGVALVRESDESCG